MKNKVVTIIIFFIIVLNQGLMSQSEFTLSGYVKDSKTGEEIIGVNVYVEELKAGAVTNLYGYYSLTIPKGNYTIQYSYLGYQPVSKDFDLSSNQKLDIELVEKENELNEILITSEKADANIQSNRMSVVKLDVKQIKTIPVIFGEQDILKTIQLTPGVQSSGEGSSGFYVRGGSADQNLILLDEAPVYNASHLLGFFSVFNSDAIKNVELIKGGIPANYGGRLSSVLDIKMNEGNLKNYSVSGGVGLISSRLMVEGPIQKDKSSFIITGRRTYADLLTQTFGTEEMKNIGLYFYDYNIKANYIIDQNNRLFLSGYFGRDVFNFDERFGFNWGNKTATLRWNHLFSDKLFMYTSLIFSDYDYVIGFEVGSNRLDITSSIRDYNLKQDYQYYINPKNTLKFGFNAIHHTFFPGEISFGDEKLVNNKIIEKRYAIESGLYVSDDVELSDKLKLNYGLRYSNFNLVGPGTYYEFNQEGTVSDTITYNNSNLVKTYHGFEPRISANYLINPSTSIKMSYSRIYQYLHLITKATSASPTDLWLPSSNVIKPQYCDQYNLGLFKNLNNNQFEFSTEIYYKDLYNQIDYKNGADLTLNEMVESQLVFGKGRAYGLELSLEKKEGNFTGWISYTLSRTERKFDAVNNGSWYPAKQDRTHNFAIVGTYKLNDRWTFSADWVYYTGDAVTFPSGKYKIDNYTVNLYTERNGYRMPDYHRLDVGATYNKKKTGKYESSWNFSVYNAYGHKNPYSISFRENTENPMMTEAVRLSLFTYVPSVTYNFKF